VSGMLDDSDTGSSIRCSQKGKPKIGLIDLKDRQI
jgi:hypothetical protein